jgi:protein-tyrosine kinase
VFRVSRIDEALRRAALSRNAAVPAPPAQVQFVSAWRDKDCEEPVERSFPDSTRSNGQGKRSRTVLADEAGYGLPLLNTALGDRLASSPDCHPVLIEQFRHLSATLQKAQARGRGRVVLVTSAVASDGKTLTAINLSLVLAGSYRFRVLLIDADLRRPSIGQMVGLNGVPGLSEALKAGKDERLSLVRLTPNLSLLPSGRPDPDPVSGLSSPRMRALLEEASAQFDWVIVDAPPVEPTADVSLLAEITDGILFVLRAGATQYPAVQRALDLLGRERILGLVLNGTSGSTKTVYGYLHQVGR